MLCSWIPFDTELTFDDLKVLETFLKEELNKTLKTEYDLQICVISATGAYTKLLFKTNYNKGDSVKRNHLLYTKYEIRVKEGGFYGHFDAILDIHGVANYNGYLWEDCFGFYKNKNSHKCGVAD